MRLFFFSDVHGCPESLALFLDHVKTQKPDLLLLLGDVLYHGPRNPLKPDYAPQQVATLLNPFKEKLVAVRGNCDSEVDQMLLDFPIMSDYSTVVADGHRFFLTHGHHWNPQQPPPLGSGDVLASGHTHIPMLQEIAAGLIAFNPGSISLPKGGYPASYGVYENETLRVLELESEKTLKELTLRAGLANA